MPSEQEGGYQPSEEEVKAAEESMTPVQKRLSEVRGTIIREGTDESTLADVKSAIENAENNGSEYQRFMAGIFSQVVDAAVNRKEVTIRLPEPASWGGKSRDAANSETFLAWMLGMNEESWIGSLPMGGSALDDMIVKISRNEMCMGSIGLTEPFFKIIRKTGKRDY